ncbi:MAG: hypothetical protein NTW87_02825 [Planctomycetota bacterium]|nr:hypothetical protein [Planctomycetota bacterium]
MRPTLLVLFIPMLVLGAWRAPAQDKEVAQAYATAAATLSTAGRIEKAKEQCYKALALDDECSNALYELGKIFEKEGKNTAAADFLLRAERLYAKQEAADPAVGPKRQDAERRVRTLNPYAGKLTEYLTYYAQELGGIYKKSPDALTAAETSERVTALQLADFVPPEKLPVVDSPTPAVAPTPSKTVAKTPARTEANPGLVQPVAKREVVNSIPVDVERALKNAGWSKITGTWKKKGEGIYEVTDGSLETPKVDGSVGLYVHKLDAGFVKVMVRNARKETILPKDIKGYGYKIEGSNARMYSASRYGSSYGSGLGMGGSSTGSGGGSSSYLGIGYRDIPLPETNSKNQFVVSIQDGALQMFVNGKREYNGNYKLPKEGPFIIEIDGTITIEEPTAKGQ